MTHVCCRLHVERLRRLLPIPPNRDLIRQPVVAMIASIGDESNCAGSCAEPDCTSLCSPLFPVFMGGNPNCGTQEQDRDQELENGESGHRASCPDSWNVKRDQHAKSNPTTDDST